MALAVPRTWVVGEVVTAAMQNAEIRDQFNDLIAGGTAFTPSWTATTTNPVIGNGTLVGRSKLIGKMCTATLEGVMGTTTTFGAGTWMFSLPYTAASPGSTSANWAWIGSARAHSATTWYTGASAVVKGTAILRVFSHAAGTEWSPTQPHSWVGASTNYLHAQITYEIA